MSILNSVNFENLTLWKEIVQNWQTKWKKKINEASHWNYQENRTESNPKIAKVCWRKIWRIKTQGRKERKQNRVWGFWECESPLFTKVQLILSQKFLNVVVEHLDISWKLLNISKLWLHISKWQKLFDLLIFSNDFLEFSL